MKTEIKKITELKSVGSGIDQAGILYPQNIDGTFDTSDGVDIHDASDEWLNALDDKDAGVVQAHLKTLRIGTKVKWGSYKQDQIGTVLQYAADTDQYLVRFETTTNWFSPNELLVVTEVSA